MKLLLLAPLLFAAADRAAWETAPRWHCTMTRLRLCEGMAGACSLRPSDAQFRIDFPAATFSIDPMPDLPESAAASPEDKHPLGEEGIAVRDYLPGDFTKLGLDSGDTLTLATAPDAKGGYPAILTRAQIDDQYSFYGSCRPLP